MAQDIFTDAAQWLNNRRERKSRSVTTDEINRANRYRSDKTTADEMRIVFYCILVAATAVTVFLAYNYYLTVFTPISPDWGWAVAAVLSLITEIGKCTLLLYVCYAIFFGWYRQSWGQFAYYGMGLCLSIGTYFWSIHISTRGAQEYAIQQAERTVPRDSLAGVIAAATAAIDGQIGQENSARTTAQGTKWKNTTTVQGQRTADRATRNIEALQGQRAAIVAQVTADYRDGLLKRGDRINHLANFIRRSGGWLELASFLCIVALGLNTVNLVRTRRKEEKEPGASAQDETATFT